jgi:hypothetical protein
MTTTAPSAGMNPLTRDLDRAHGFGVSAAEAGLQDPGLGVMRLTGRNVHSLADAAVTSATPFLRAPLLSRLAGVRRLHSAASADGAECPSCRVPVPCPTAQELQW